MYAFRSAYDAHDAKKKLDLRDEAGNRIIASRMATGRSAITERMLRREVSRDLEGLLNTIALESTLDLYGCDYVRKSVINFGLPDITHRHIDDHSVNEIADELQTVLTHFEPRLVPGSISVSRDTTVDTAELKIRFHVHADLSCDPVNVPVEFIADIEVDTGKFRINRL